MKFLLIFLIIVALLSLLYVLSLKGRRGNRDTEKFLKVRFAHRGLHNKPTTPENSMSAFCLAVEKGYGIELDVHLMADGRLAVIHDSSLKRTANADIRIEELVTQDLNAFNLEESDEKIPLFSEVLKLVDGRVPLLVEIKTEGNVAAVTKAAVQELKNYAGDYCIESFDPRSILWLKNHAPHIVRGQLTQNFIKEDANLSFFTRLLLTPLFLNFLNRPDFIAVKDTDRKGFQIKVCKKLWKMPLFAWTITDKNEAEELEKEGYTLIFEQFQF